MTDSTKQDWARTLLQVAAFALVLGGGWIKVESRLTSIESTLKQSEQSMRNVSSSVAGLEAIRLDLRLLDMRMTRLEEESKGRN